jgi:hypothetical protein
MKLLERLRRIRLRPFDRSDYGTESERTVENPDALAATGGRGTDPSGLGHAQFPPDYVKTDDGRPRH